MVLKTKPLAKPAQPGSPLVPDAALLGSRVAPIEHMQLMSSDAWENLACERLAVRDSYHQHRPVDPGKPGHRGTASVPSRRRVSQLSLCFPVPPVTRMRRSCGFLAEFCLPRSTRSVWPTSPRSVSPNSLRSSRPAHVNIGADQADRGLPPREFWLRGPHAIW